MYESLAVLVPILLAVGGVVAAHFMGIEKAISAARLYTDQKVEQLLEISEKRFDKIDKKMEMIIHTNEEIKIKFVELKGKIL